MLLINSLNSKTTFGSHKKFKRMFAVCAYSGQPFKTGDTRTLEHIIPKDRGGDSSLGNLIVVRRQINGLRSDEFLGDFINKHPEVLDNILKTLKRLKGKIIEGINWAEDVKQALFQETGNPVFK